MSGGYRRRWDVPRDDVGGAGTPEAGDCRGGYSHVVYWHYGHARVNDYKSRNCKFLEILCNRCHSSTIKLIRTI